LIRGKPLPEGWLGKNHACFQLADHASGDVFLFLDADVIITDPAFIQRAATFLKKHHLGLISVFPIQQLNSLGEQITVPIMNYILLSLLPLVFVRYSPFSSHSAANGQFMMFDANVYRMIKPHQRFKDNPVEDIATARFLKRQKIKIACITSESAIQCRMYDSYHNALSGFSKNIFMFFGNVKIFAFLFWLLSFIGPVIMLFTSTVPTLILYFGLILSSLLLYANTSKQNLFVAVILYPMQLIFMLHVMIKALISKNKQQWKGRFISS
ncbi:MAG TPA: glycosyltransferase family A protein, partial [Salinivirgaceae bacterium]|nr:glycosyltransferase family A protein [Salinivirgaceae bacterium]